MSDNGLRLNKFISDSGFCSRREADAYIAAGQVSVNGQLAHLGTQVNEGDHVKVKGKLLASKPPPVYLAYHKPTGITCTTDPEVPGNIVDAVRYSERIFPIGRLDKESEGLILLTNDGDIVNKILRAGNAHDKEYLVWVDQAIGPDFASRMAAGVPILGTRTLPCQVSLTGSNSFKIVLQQGLNRQIRRMCEHLGYRVTRLKRTRIMHLSLANLKLGQWRRLTAKEMATMMALVAQSSKVNDSPKPRPARSSAAKAKPTSSAPTKAKAPAPKTGGYKGKPQNNQRQAPKGRRRG